MDICSLDFYIKKSYDIRETILNLAYGQFFFAIRKAEAPCSSSSRWQLALDRYFIRWNEA